MYYYAERFEMMLQRAGESVHSYIDQTKGLDE